MFFYFLAVVSDWAGQEPPAISIQVQVEPNRVVFTLMNQGPDVVLQENLMVEQWDEAGQTWRFAASPLWLCGSKETIFAKSLAAGKQMTLDWNKSLHKGCLKAGPGRYRILVQDRQGQMNSLPVEFEIPALVEKVRDPESRETVYRIRSKECYLSWVIRDAELNQGIVLHRPSCFLSLKDQAPQLLALLKAVVESGTLPQPGWTLDWGRLTPTNASCYELSQRLMLAAHQSKDWDAKRGKPRQGHENIFVRQIAERAGIYSELKEIFQAQGFELTISNVEKVLILKAKDLPCYSNLKSRGVGLEEKLPFDCQVWFRVRAKSAA